MLMDILKTIVCISKNFFNSNTHVFINIYIYIYKYICIAIKEMFLIYKLSFLRCPSTSMISVNICTSITQVKI